MQFEKQKDFNKFFSRKGRQGLTENEIGKLVVDSAIAVHRELGPGLLETVYEVILAHELRQRGLGVERQVPISIELLESIAEISSC